MPTSVIALQILIILLPGFAAASIVQMMATRGSQTDFDKVVESALYSFLIYATFALLNHGALPFAIVPAKPPTAEATIAWNTAQIFLLLGVTFAVAILATVYINRDWNSIFRKLKLTERTTRRSIWNDIFQHEATAVQIVQIELENDRSLRGLLTYYSDFAEDNALYVEQASWIAADGSTSKVHGPGVLLTSNAKIKSVSLLDEPSELSSEEAPDTDS